MAIPTNIKTLLSGEVVEWARIEFKETWDAAASLKTICAFAEAFLEEEPKRVKKELKRSRKGAKKRN